MNILFVCTGNTCRSPMAEGYLNSKKISGVKAVSRGIAADGSPVSRNSALAMAEKDIDISSHISSQITAEDVDNTDKIICLSPSHKNTLLILGVPESKLFVLGNGISDPFGGDLNIYRQTRDEIFTEIDKLTANGFFEDIKIVPLEREHIKKIAKLESLCFSSEAWSENVIIEAFESGTKFFIAEKENKFAGYVGIKTVLDEGYIANIAVCPEYRGKGIATRLLEKLFSLAVEKALSFITLEVRASNIAAISLYEKLGFKEEGRRKNFYKEPTEDGIIMTKRFNINNEDS